MPNIKDIASKVEAVLNDSEAPKEVLPATGVICIASERKGLSAYRTTAKVLEKLQKLDIPTGPNEDGSPNIINQFVYAIVDSIFDAIQNEAVVTSTIPRQSLFLLSKGANGGGPVECIGTNQTDSNSRGIIQ